VRVPAYFASDIHLRPDRPERGWRFARWLESLGTDDSLTIVGDLCDFWFASRFRPWKISACEGLSALSRFIKRGASVLVITGNHDAWMSSFYEQQLGARVGEAAQTIETEGLRIHITHGHHLGGRSVWKQGMESRLFLKLFRIIPGACARGLEGLLSLANERTREASDLRHLSRFRRYANTLKETADLAVFGHIHGAYDDRTTVPRMIVLGTWLEGLSYLKVDATGARLVTEPGSS
jgi:UDP-2,3-diacylglucosamine hydrolase